MPIEITINTITGSTPDYDVYVCDTGMTSCVYVSTIDNGDIPYTFEAPFIFNSFSQLNVKVVDDNGCEIIQTIIV